jgi:hypothetical protein
MAILEYLLRKDTWKKFFLQKFKVISLRINERGTIKRYASLMLSFQRFERFEQQFHKIQLFRRSGGG